MIILLQALNYLPNLEELNASGNRIRSVADLSKCKHLQEVDLSRNRITDLSGLKGLPRLLVSKLVLLTQPYLLNLIHFVLSPFFSFKIQ